MDQSLGLILFSGIDDFEAYLEAADAMEHGEAPTMAMMPSALKLFAEGRLPRVAGDAVEVAIGGRS